MSNPKIHPEARVASGAKIIGDVTLEKGANVWYNAVLRADIGKIVIGENTNIQDCACVHLSEHSSTILGSHVTVGHGAIIHGCVVDDDTLIGMGAIVMDNAKIGKNCIIAAGAVVLENAVIPDNSLAVGCPAKVIRENPPAIREENHEHAAQYAVTPMPEA